MKYFGHLFYRMSIKHAANDRVFFFYRIKHRLMNACVFCNDRDGKIMVLGKQFQFLAWRTIAFGRVKSQGQDVLHVSGNNGLE